MPETSGKTEQLAERDFIAALPKRLLAHPRGPIAFIGHLDTAFLHGFADASQPHTLDRWHARIAPFKKAVDRLLGVQPSGLAMEGINERYAYVRTSGEVEILGQNIQAPGVSLVELRRSVGMVFQRPNPLPLSIYDNVVFGLRLHSRRAELKRPALDHAVEDALTQVGLWKDVKDRLRMNATRLQLEQQQKLCIARLIPLKPEVILMDEPCSALDVEGTHAIEELMFGLKEHYTIVIVTHNMAQARRVSDECIFMLLGRVIEHDHTEDLFLSPRNPRTAEYIEGRYG